MIGDLKGNSEVTKKGMNLEGAIKAKIWISDLERMLLVTFISLKREFKGSKIMYFIPHF